MSHHAIELTGLTKRYGNQRGIDDVSFSVEPGEVFGFIGPNGAGKSTTIRSLLALIHPTGGSARIFGQDCIQQASEIARDVGYLAGESGYYENMRVRELLAYTAALYRVDAVARTAELAERLRLDTSRRISDLSLGNKRKVGIVASLLHSPKLVILDEPTSGLDPLVQQEFFEILAEENAKGMTVFFSSHVLSEVQRVCDRVAIVREGRVVDLQDVAELRRNGYKKVTLAASAPVEAELAGLDGVAQYHQDGQAASFMYQGAVGDLVSRLARLDLTDVFIEEPTLEEVFLHYYK